jgi:hypothetical protein
MSDSELTIDGLASRLERVERLNNGLRRVIALLAALVAIFIFISQSNVWPMTSRNVVAESFSVRNSNGNTVALLSVTSDGTGFLSLQDAQRNTRLSIGLDVKGSPYVTLADAQRNPRATLSLNNNQEPTLLLADAQKKVRATFGLDGNNSPVLEFYDSNGVRRWVATTGGAKEILVPK